MRLGCSSTLECGESLARGVAEYRDEFEPGADELMAKFEVCERMWRTIVINAARKS